MWPISSERRTSPVRGAGDKKHLLKMQLERPSSSRAGPLARSCACLCVGVGQVAGQDRDAAESFSEPGLDGIISQFHCIPARPPFVPLLKALEDDFELIDHEINDRPTTQIYT